MSKRVFAIVISMAVLAATIGLQSAFGQTISNPAATRARARVESFGNDARVEVKLHDKTKVKGNVTAMTADTFTVTDSRTGMTSTLAYADVDEVKKSSSGPSMKSWLIIGGVAVGALVTWAIVKPAFCDGGAQTKGIC